MFQNIIDLIEKIDKKILNIINIGLHIGFIICIIGIILLAIHYKIYISPNLYFIGIGVFKLGLWTAVSFIICGVGLWCVKERM
ncbi:MAG: hypothetical protein IKG42_02430 [Clostridia bacterium]|nr:hypothetical protein [Clostridia bacterium]